MLTIQGEFCAPGIQQNRLKLKKPEWYVFTIRENGKRVGLNRMTAICKALDLNTVPIEEVGIDVIPGSSGVGEAHRQGNARIPVARCDDLENEGVPFLHSQCLQRFLRYGIWCRRICRQDRVGHSRITGNSQLMRYRVATR